MKYTQTAISSRIGNEEMNSCIRNDWRSGAAPLNLTLVFDQRADQLGVFRLGIVDGELLAIGAHAANDVGGLVEGDFGDAAILHLLQEGRVRRSPALPRIAR